MKAILKFSAFSLIAILFASCVGDVAEEQDVEALETEFKSEMDVPAVEHKISGNKDTMIFGEQGTAVFLDSNSLQFDDGTIPTGNIEVKIQEYYQTSDIVTQDLSTMSEEGLLETGGMVNVTAWADGLPLRLKPGKEAIVHFPRNGNKKKMDLFSGSRNAQGQMVWSKEPTTEGHVEDHISYWYQKFDGLDDNNLYLEDGRSMHEWIAENMAMSDWEQDYVMFRDVNLYYTITKDGDMINRHYKMDYDKKFEKRMMEAAKSAPKFTPYTVRGVPVDMEGHFEYNVRVIPPSYGTNGSYLKSIEGKYPEFEKQGINSLDKAELHYYIFNSAKLDWMNCDRFVDDDSPKVDMTLDLDDPEGVMAKLVYKEFKSVVPPKIVDKSRIFKQIPSGKDVTLLLIRYGKEDVKMSITEMVTKAGKITNYKFKDYTMGELKKELEKLN